MDNKTNKDCGANEAKAGTLTSGAFAACRRAAMWLARPALLAAPYAPELPPPDILPAAGCDATAERAGQAALRPSRPHENYSEAPLTRTVDTHRLGSCVCA